MSPRTSDRTCTRRRRGTWSRDGRKSRSTSRRSDPSGTAIHRFSAPSATGWHRFLADVSSTSSLAGLYNVSVGIRVVADNTSASVVEVRVDEVSILFPNRQNGTYLSGAVPLGATSEFLQVYWTF